MRSASVALGVNDPDRVWGALGHHRIPEQDRDDIAQDILIATLEGRRKRGAEIENPERWFNGIILNQIRRWRRRRAVEQTRSEIELGGRVTAHDFEPEDAAGEREAFDHTKNPEEHLMSETRRRLLYQFLDELPANQLDVVVAHDLEELPFEDIAAAFGKSYSTVHGYYEAGMRNLRLAHERWKAKQRDGGALLMPIPLASLFDAARATPERPTAEDVERILRRVRDAVSDDGPDSSAPSSAPRGIDPARRINVFFTLPAIGYLLVGQSQTAAELADAAPRDDGPALVVHAEAPVATVGAPPSVMPSASSLNASASASAELAAQQGHAASVGSAEERRAYNREQAIFDKAREAAALGDTQAELSALREHAKLYPNGTYARQRDRMWIDALVKLGRTAEACQRAESFHRAYPTSTLSPEIDKLCTGRH